MFEIELILGKKFMNAMVPLAKVYFFENMNASAKKNIY